MIKSMLLLAVAVAMLTGCASTGGPPGAPRMKVSDDTTYPPTIDVAVFCQGEIVLNGRAGVQRTPPYWPSQDHEVFSTIKMEWTQIDTLGMSLSGTASGVIGGGAMFPELSNVIPGAQEGELDRVLRERILPMARERGADAVAITSAQYSTKYRGSEAVTDMAMEWHLIKYIP